MAFLDLKMGKNRAAVMLGCGKINDDREAHIAVQEGERT